MNIFKWIWNVIASHYNNEFYPRYQCAAVNQHRQSCCCRYKNHLGKHMSYLDSWY